MDEFSGINPRTYDWLLEQSGTEFDMPFNVTTPLNFFYMKPIDACDATSVPTSDIIVTPIENFTVTGMDFREKSLLEGIPLHNQSTQTTKSPTVSLIDTDEIETHKQKFADTLLTLIHEEIFEYGMENAADVFVQKSLEMGPYFTKEWLNTIFLHRLGDVEVTTGILRIIAHLDYEDIYPTGPTMAIAAGMHENAEIRECGIRAFENWCNADSLKYLKRIRCKEKWLQDYLEQVIIDLEEYNVASR